MLTPQEVSGKVFPKASFGGYAMSVVDEFLDTLTEDYTNLYTENATLKAKLKVLAGSNRPYCSISVTPVIVFSAVISATFAATALRLLWVSFRVVSSV